MASVLFSTVGQAIGGPLGAGVGAAVGATVDTALFRRQRPAVSDVYVQRSAYGSAVPRLFGTTRTAGQMIWATPMVVGGQAKGSGRRAAVTSFAVALSVGPISAIRRIWADGREIRTADGQFETATTMRIHVAGEAAPDPLIVAAEGIGLAPGFQGLSYVMLENFDLGPFGNRIPNLSFEVVADMGGPGDWLSTLGAGVGVRADLPDAGTGATGYLAVADRPTEDLSILSAVAGSTLAYSDGALIFRGEPRTFEIPARDVLALDSGEGGGPQLTRAERPTGFGLDYLDPGRDFQLGRQRVARGRAGRELTASWPLSTSAESAYALAARLLRKAEAGAEALVISLSWRWLDLAVGDQFRLADGPYWRIVRRDIRGLVLRVEAERVQDRTDEAEVIVEAGRSLAAPLIPATATIVAPIEPPVPLQGTAPALFLAAGGEGAWRGADISLLANGETVQLGTATSGAAIGKLAAPLPPGVDSLWDEAATISVEVDPDGPPFLERPDAEILAGANLVVIGTELLQFRSVERLGPGAVRLRGLLRGRFGTGGQMAVAQPGTTVLSVNPGLLPALALGPDQLGRALVLLATGRGDPPGGTELAYRVEGRGMAPLAPVHVRCTRMPDGSLETSWVARHRELWSWSGGSDPAPPACMWRFESDAGIVWDMVVNGLTLTLSVAEQTTRFGGVLPSGSVAVEAIGDGPVELRRSRSVRV